MQSRIRRCSHQPCRPESWSRQAIAGKTLVENIETGAGDCR